MMGGSFLVTTSSETTTSLMLGCDGMSYMTSSMIFSMIALSPRAPDFRFIASRAMPFRASSVNFKCTLSISKSLEMESVHLKFTEEALKGIAREAMKRKSGARGLRAIMENIMLDVMYDMPTQPNIKEV